MEIIRFSLSSFPAPVKGLTLCLGTFDGMHRGHQQLFLEARLRGEGPSGILLFSSSPNEVLHLGKHETVLTSLEDKIRLSHYYNLDYCFVVEATKEFYGLSPKDFIEQVLLPLGTKEVVCGTDFTYGNKAEGKPSLLKEYFKVHELSLIYKDKEKIGTRCIKPLIEKGDIEEANDLLGRDYEIRGVVEHGLENGRKIGFPTMNLCLDSDYTLPKTGVYFGYCYVRGLPYKAMINVGVNPTVGARATPIVEAHLLHYSLGENYGERVFLTFKKKRRGEIKFASFDELKAQLTSDLAWTEEQE